LQDKLDKKTTFVLGDLLVLSLALPLREVKDESTKSQQDYCLIGYLNEDKTKFKDIVTGKIYDYNKGWHYSLVTTETEYRFFMQMFHSSGYAGRYSYACVMDIPDWYRDTNKISGEYFLPLELDLFDLKDLDMIDNIRILLEGRYPNSAISLYMIKRIKAFLNNIALENIKNKADQLEFVQKTREGYDVNF